MVCIIFVLMASVWWEFNGAKSEFAGINLKLPDFGQSVSLQNVANGSLAQNNGPDKKYSSPDGNLSFEYPADYKGGENLFGQDALGKLKSNNILLFVYKISIPDLQPAYIVALESDATSTQAASDKLKEALAQQQCAGETQNATSTNPAIFAVLNTNYECAGAQKGYDQWQAQSALVKKDSGFYAVSAVSTVKNWPSFQTQVQLIFNSIAAATTTAEMPPAPPEPVKEPPENNQ